MSLFLELEEYLVHIMTYEADVLLLVPEAALRDHVMLEITQVTHDIADAAMLFMRSDAGGYFPGLESLEAGELLDEELLNAVQTLTWFSSKYARETLSSKLKNVFSHIRVHTVRPMPYMMPSVRKTDKNIHSKLVEHYNCSRVRVSIKMQQVLKKEPQEDISGYARKMLWKWLKSDFDDMRVLHVNCS